MLLTRRIEWPARQMYSRKHPIGRTQIVEGFARALEALAESQVATPELLESREAPGAEYLGYSAPTMTWCLRAGSALLEYQIEPILSSMGVSGERHDWTSKGLVAGLSIRGTALSSGREKSYAEIRVECESEARCEHVVRAFLGAFPTVMTVEALELELGPR